MNDGWGYCDSFYALSYEINLGLGTQEDSTQVHDDSHSVTVEVIGTDDIVTMSFTGYVTRSKKHSGLKLLFDNLSRVFIFLS